MKTKKTLRAEAKEKWYWAHRDEQLAKGKAMRDTPEYKRKRAEYYQKHKVELNMRQRERRLDRRAEVYTKWRAKMVNRKDDQCFVCGITDPHKRNEDIPSNLILHHLNYDIPELVTTLCYSCHRKVHAGKIRLSFEAKKCPTCNQISYVITKLPAGICP